MFCYDTPMNVVNVPLDKLPSILEDRCLFSDKLHMYSHALRRPVIRRIGCNAIFLPPGGNILK